MKYLLQFLSIVALLSCLVTVGVVWKFYSYGECIKVGHSQLYCVMSMGK